jgi:opacity protein-like surface antigen
MASEASYHHQSGRRLWAIFAAIFGVTVIPARMLAQAGSGDIGEVSGYTGVAFQGIGTHPTVGASTGLAFSRYGIAFVDVSYIPLGSHTLRHYPSQVNVNNSRLYDFNFTINVRVPLRERWEPYGIAGAAFLFSSYSVAPIRAPFVARAFVGRTDANFGFETGGGVRYYIAKNWGVRAEMRYTASARGFSRFLTGLFYQFETDWFFPLRVGGAAKP